MYISSLFPSGCPVLSSLDEMILMMCHKICFYEEIWLIIPKLSVLPLLIWSTDVSLSQGCSNHCHLKTIHLDLCLQWPFKFQLKAAFCFTITWAFFPQLLIYNCSLTLLHSERPKLHAHLAILSAVGLTSTRVSSAVLVASSRAVSKFWHICAWTVHAVLLIICQTLYAKHILLSWWSHTHEKLNPIALRTAKTP